ncbi:two-component system LytT family sensor kinase [Flavobacterium sp. W4I14]|nr:two-component system LytT family sensor kinase [Flavobacterium sp. W4I14]
MEPVIHAILWIFFIGGEVLSVALLTGSYSSPIHYVSFYLLNIALFYSYVWLLFRIPEKSPFPWLWVLLIFISMMVLYVGLAGMLTTILKNAAYKANPISIFTEKFIVSTSWRGFYFMLFGTGYVALKINSRRRINELAKAVEIAQLKEELMSTEKAFLRSQINPHFLFNTLSFINHATKYYPENARTAIALLSEIMDYALESNKEEFVLLSEEVEQIDNMIALNRLRFGDKLNLVFEKSPDCGTARIVPLIMLTLVENVFKHGNLLHETEVTSIKLVCTEKSIVFITSNPLDRSKGSQGEQTGLKNIQARLSNSYPKRHLFVSGAVNERFITELTIEL